MRTTPVRVTVALGCLLVVTLATMGAISGGANGGPAASPTVSVDLDLAADKQAQVDGEQAALDQAGKLASQSPTPDYDALARQILETEVTSCPREVGVNQLRPYGGVGNPVPFLAKTNFVTLPPGDSGEYVTIYAGALYEDERSSDATGASALVISRSPVDYCAKDAGEHTGGATYTPAGFTGLLTLTGSGDDFVEFREDAGAVGRVMVAKGDFILPQ